MHAHATKGGARSTAILTCAIVVYGPSQKKSGVQLNLPIFMAISMVSLHCFSLLRHLIMYNGSAQMGHLKARSAWALCDELRTMLVNNACLPVHSLLILNQVLRIWDRAAIETLGVFFKLNLQYLHIFSDFFLFCPCMALCTVCMSLWAAHAPHAFEVREVCVGTSAHLVEGHP